MNSQWDRMCTCGRSIGIEKESEPKQNKLAPIADGPFEVQGSNADTAVISYRDDTVERISKDRVVRAQVSAEDIVTPGHDE